MLSPSAMSLGEPTVDGDEFILSPNFYKINKMSHVISFVWEWLWNCENWIVVGLDLVVIDLTSMMFRRVVR